MTTNEPPPSKWAILRERLVGTSEIDPKEYALKVSRSRLDSLGYALAGWIYMLRRQRNTWIMAFTTPLIGGLAFWLKVDLTSWALLCIVVTIVWLTEFMNAAVEASIDLTTSEYHPMAKVGKDVASAAVLLGVVNSVVVGLLILGPPLWERASVWLTFIR
ncbi:MAG: diacylglycerol kinase [Phototrophicaceae bacterium]